MQRLERVINLITALLDTERPLTRSELQERVPGYEGESASARRTFERDKQMLRDMGLPLIAEDLDPDHPEDGTGYRIPKDDYQLPDPQFTRDEMAALAVAASAIKLHSQSAAAALWKLGGAPDIDITDDVDLAGEDALAAFFAARRERRTTTFTYSNKVRTFDPYNLSFRNGHWYVNGRDHAYEDRRTYRLDRVDGEISVSEPDAFEQPPSPAIRMPVPWQMGTEAMTTVELLVDAEHADLALTQVGVDAEVKRNADDSVVIAVGVRNQEAFRSFVLGFLDHAEILSPPDVRGAFVEYVSSQVGDAS